MNLFSTLFRFGSDAAEDQLTEAFAFLLRLLIERDATQGYAILSYLCGFTISAPQQPLDTIRISTQVCVKHGCVDMEIRDGGNTLVYVEVKDAARLSKGQLEGYRCDLDESGIARTGLVFLTRSRAASHHTTLNHKQHHHVCWYQVAAQLARAATHDAVCRYFLGSFLAFLEEKSMTMRKVSGEYVQGVTALVDLMKVMEAALTESIDKVQFVRTGGFSHCGYLVNNRYLFGVRYQNPALLTFESNMGYPPKTFERRLNLQTASFFSMSEGEQYERIVAFVLDAWLNAEPQPSPSGD